MSGKITDEFGSVAITKDMTYDVVEMSCEAFVAEVAARVKDGWAISTGNPGYVLPLGSGMCVTMFRNNDTVKALKDAVASVAEAPKPSRAEILAKARAAKAAKMDANVITIND